jgi:hypothetical protein
MRLKPEAEVLAILEAIEQSAACSLCGRLSLAVMKGSAACPYCDDLGEEHAYHKQDRESGLI